MIDAANICLVAQNRYGINPGAALWACALALRLAGREVELFADGSFFRSPKLPRAAAVARSKIQLLPGSAPFVFSSGRFEADEFLLQEASADSTSIVISNDRFRLAHDGTYWKERYPLPFQRKQLLDFDLKDGVLSIPELGPTAQAPILDFFRAIDAGEISLSK